MNIGDYYDQVFVPGNVAISAMRRAGIAIDLDRVSKTYKQWERKIEELESFVEGEAAKRGIALRYSEKHNVYYKTLGEFLFSSQGLDLEPTEWTEKTGNPSTSEGALKAYACLANPSKDDDPIVTAILKIRSLAGANAKYFTAFRRTVRADGCVHPTINWGKVRTARLSMENPPMHQIPEKSDAEVALGVKSCMIPRTKPCKRPEDWDPRKHGSCFRWDIAGAEAAIRVAMLTAKFCPQPDPVGYEYIREGKDIHGKTGSFLLDKPEGTFKKGDMERDVVGKQCNFLLLYGGGWRVLQDTVWDRARVWIDDEEAQRYREKFFELYPMLAYLYEFDKAFLGKYGYCEDGYGRRRFIEIPDSARYKGFRNGQAYWKCDDDDDWGKLNHAFKIAANTPTQSINANDTMWMLALLHAGEYVDLAVPPMWEKYGVEFPEATGWRLHEGLGPGGKPLKAWHCNTVHDSGWGDCAPGHLEPTAKVIWRRCRAIPFDWRLETDVPYRIDLKVGPDFGHMKDYNKVCGDFGMELLPEY